MNSCVRGAEQGVGPNQALLILLVEEAPEGGYAARALGSSLLTEADTLDELRANVRDAVACHFDDGTGPRILRLHFVREEVLAP